MLVDVHLNWLNFFHFCCYLILVADPHVTSNRLHDFSVTTSRCCMSMSTVSFLAQLEDLGILCLQNAFLWALSKQLPHIFFILFFLFL